MIASAATLGAALPKWLADVVRSLLLIRQHVMTTNYIQDKNRLVFLTKRQSKLVQSAIKWIMDSSLHFKYEILQLRYSKVKHMVGET